MKNSNHYRKKTSVPQGFDHSMIKENDLLIEKMKKTLFVFGYEILQVSLMDREEVHREYRKCLSNL